MPGGSVALLRGAVAQRPLLAQASGRPPGPLRGLRAALQPVLRPFWLSASGASCLGTFLGAPGLLGTGGVAGDSATPGAPCRRNIRTAQGALRGVALDDPSLAPLLPAAFCRQCRLAVLIGPADAAAGYRPTAAQSFRAVVPLSCGPPNHPGDLPEAVGPGPLGDTLAEGRPS